MSTSLLRLFSRAHYWVNKYILNNACELQRVVLYFKELFRFRLDSCALQSWRPQVGLVAPINHDAILILAREYSRGYSSLSSHSLFLVNARPFPEHSSSRATFSAGRAWLEARRLGASSRYFPRKLAVVIAITIWREISHGASAEARAPYMSVPVPPSSRNIGLC